MENNKIYNEDCFDTMNRMIEDGHQVDLILTSPPYNTSRTLISESAKEWGLKSSNIRYDVYSEGKSVEDYIEWSINLFNLFDKILKPNGCILYNMCYGNENPTQMILTISDILKRTPFTMADIIIWKKYSAIPNNVSPNKLTRICEFVFVLCRKSEYNTFYMNKNIACVGKNGQNFYENLFNFIEAPNNDFSTDINKATFSSSFVEQLLKIYCNVKFNPVVYDPFMGTGTTAYACSKIGVSYIGSELSSQQCQYADNRLKNVKLSLF